MRSLLKQIAHKFACSKPGGWMIWFILRYFPFLIPFKKLYQNPYLIAISHPVPSYLVHILILPRIYLPDFLALDPKSETGSKIVQSVFQALSKLCKKKEHKNTQLIINGGEYQDVKLLHMHLIENDLVIPLSKLLQTDNSSAGLSELILQAKQLLQNTEHSAYRLLFSFQENQIHLRLQMK